MGLVNLVKKLDVSILHPKKLWFFKVNSFLKNENLRMYSVPLEVVIRNLKTDNLLKLPDPRDFIIGLNFVRPKRPRQSTLPRQKGQSRSL